MKQQANTLNFCGKLWLEGEGVACQRERGHTGECAAEYYFEGEPNRRGKLWWRNFDIPKEEA
jgi:hypothetical protein